MNREWFYGFFRSDQGKPLKMSRDRDGVAFQESKGWHRSKTGKDGGKRKPTRNHQKSP